MAVTKSKQISTKTSLLAAVLLLVVISLWSFTLSPYFQITELVVRGQYFCPQDYLAAVLDPDRLGNIFLLSTSTLTRKLEQNPWITNVQVKRKLPRTLEVSITETYPVAALANGEGFVLVTPKGVAVENVKQFSQYDVPVLTTVVPVPVKIGEPINLPGFSQTIQAISEIQCSGIPATLSEANLSADRQLTLYFAGGLKIQWGGLEKNDQKLQILMVITSEEAGHLDHIAEINLSDEAGPVVRYKPD